MAKFTYVYNFKSLTQGKYDELLSTLDDPSRAEGQFDIDMSKPAPYKRKSVQVELDMPDFLVSTPAWVQSAAQEVIAAFVKMAYVEQFLPVGSHTEKDIEEELASRGKRGSLALPEEYFELASASFKEYITKATGVVSAGERLGKIMKSQFSRNSINKEANEFSESLLLKLKGRVNEWGAWAAENDAENAEIFAEVLGYCNKRLDRHLNEKAQKLGDMI